MSVRKADILFVDHVLIVLEGVEVTTGGVFVFDVQYFRLNKARLDCYLHY
jgi:hypothetical protein